MFNLHIIQAEFGDSLLIEYGKNERKFILIDGGPSKVYNNYLRGELLNIIGEGGDLEAAVISHVDDDHIKGIVDFFVELKKLNDTNENLLINVKNLWHNSFSETVDNSGTITNRLDSIFTILAQNGVTAANSGIILDGIKDGERAAVLAIDLGIAVNAQAANGFFSLEKSTEAIKFDNLDFLIIGPTKDNLEALKEKWEEWLAKQEEDIANGQFNIASMSDKSVPNLSSIIFLVKGDDKTILFTGDSRGDFIYEGLKKRKLLKNGKLHLNVLKMPHHGSDRNMNREFLENITADTYIISANGKYSNPDYATLTWIIESANEQERQIVIIVTNETSSTKKILKDYPENDWGYSLKYIEDDKNSYFLKL